MLIVDDDEAFRDLATRIVVGWGHIVVGEAARAAEAISQAGQWRPDVVLLDIGLPDGDGFALARQLHAMPWPMRVVLISSDDDHAHAAAALRAGASGFIPKNDLSGPALRRHLDEG